MRICVGKEHPTLGWSGNGDTGQARRDRGSVHLLGHPSEDSLKPRSCPSAHLQVSSENKTPKAFMCYLLRFPDVTKFLSILMGTPTPTPTKRKPLTISGDSTEDPPRASGERFPNA